MHPFFQACVDDKLSEWNKNNPEAFHYKYIDFDDALYEHPASVVVRAVAIACPICRTLPRSVAMGYVLNWSMPNNKPSYDRFCEAIDALTELGSGLMSFCARYSPSTIARWVNEGVVAEKYAMHARIALDAEIAYCSGGPSETLLKLREARKTLIERFKIPEHDPESETPAWVYLLG